jgi:predicted Zn-dependent protease
MLQLIVMTFVLNAWAVPNPGPRSPEQAKSWYDEAVEARKSGKDDLAAENLRKLIQNYPTYKDIPLAYEHLMRIHSSRLQWNEVNSLGKQAILLNPKGRSFAAIQLLRAEAELESGKPSQTKLIIDEVIKAKPDSATLSDALILKAESLSLLGKHKEAMASLDSARDHEKFADAELKLRARACSALESAKKPEPYDYFSRKNLCFKESAALARSEPEKKAAQVWCDQFAKMDAELKQSKTDSYTREKTEKEMQITKGLSATWGCK